MAVIAARGVVAASVMGCIRCWLWIELQLHKAKAT